ncbi:MAG: hypothetical protein E6447_20590 [Bradyrhizobium sp.]|nr:hypothetical protein [Bradyrhizobium sp.]
MTIAIEMGQTAAGSPAALDLEELLATRLLVQGNSGSGKWNGASAGIPCSGRWQASRL